MQYELRILQLLFNTILCNGIEWCRSLNTLKLFRWKVETEVVMWDEMVWLVIEALRFVVVGGLVIVWDNSGRFGPDLQNTVWLVMRWWFSDFQIQKPTRSQVQFSLHQLDLIPAEQCGQIGQIALPSLLESQTDLAVSRNLHRHRFQLIGFVTGVQVALGWDWHWHWHGIVCIHRVLLVRWRDVMSSHGEFVAARQGDWTTIQTEPNCSNFRQETATANATASALLALSATAPPIFDWWFCSCHCHCHPNLELGAV